MDELRKAELKEIGARIKKARLSKKMTQSELAVAAQLSLPHISKIELGKTDMQVSTLVRIVEALQVSSDSLIRPNVPSVANIYKDELSELLSDCTADEMSSIIGIVENLKSTLHKKPNEIY